MPRPLVVLLGWLAATAAAVVVAHLGVSAVAGRVVEPLPATLGLQDVGPTVGVPSVAASPTTDAGPNDAAPQAAPTTPSAGPGTPSDAPTSRSQAAPAGEVRTYALVGGSATLRYAPGSVTVVSAQPNPGFTQEVEGSGGVEVTVEFESEQHRSRLRGAWDEGPQDRVDEDADRGDAGDDEHGDDD